MIKQLFSGFTGIFKSALIVIICIAICFAMCFAFVWHVWFVSQNHPNGFSLVVMILFSLLILYAIVRKINSGIKKAPDRKARKTYIFKLVFTTVRIVLSIALIAVAVQNVMHGYRGAGAIWLTASIILLGFTGSLSKYIVSRIKP